MARQILGNATFFKGLLTYPTSIDISGTRTTENDITCTSTAALRVGMPVILGFDGGSAGGLIDDTLYWVCAKVDSTHFQVSTTRPEQAGFEEVTISGDAGAGDTHPGLKVNGNVWVNTGGLLTAVGPHNTGQELGVFSVADQSPFPGFCDYIFNYNPEAGNATGMATGLNAMQGYANNGYA